MNSRPSACSLAAAATESPLRPWDEVEPWIRNVIGDLPVVVHSAPFDKSVYTRSCEAVGLTPAEWEWYCTQQLCEQHIGIGALAEACAHLQVDLRNHHQAGADTLSAAKVALLLAERTGASTVTELWQAVVGTKKPQASAKPRNKTGISQADFLKHTARNATRRYKTNADFPPPTPDAPANPLKGETVLVTGELHRLGRPRPGIRRRGSSRWTGH